MKSDLEAQTGRLPSLETGQLRKLWHDLFQDPSHAKLRRELLIPIEVTPWGLSPSGDSGKVRAVRRAARFVLVERHLYTCRK